MKKLYFLLTAFLLPFFGFCQNQIRPSAYYQDMLFYNPAALPEMEEFESRFLLNARNRFIDENAVFEGRTSLIGNFLTVNKEKSSYLQAGFMTNQYSFFNRNSLYFGAGKSYKLGDHSSITFGGNVTMHTDLINWSNFQLPHSETGNSFRLSPDLDFGTQFQWKNLKLGGALKNIIGLSQNLEGSEIINTKRVVVFNTSYDFHIGQKFILAPYVLFYQEVRNELDVGLFLNYDRMINVSYLIRVNELRSIFTFESRVIQGFSIGASYDTSPLLPDNSLDIFVRYFY